MITFSKLIVLLFQNIIAYFTYSWLWLEPITNQHNQYQQNHKYFSYFNYSFPIKYAIIQYWSYINTSTIILCWDKI